MDVVSELNVLFYYVKNAYQQYVATNNRLSKFEALRSDLYYNC